MRLIHDLVKDYAAANPGKIALSDPFGTLSYGELEAQSAAVSCALSALGAKPGDSVAVYVPYTKEIMLGAVAALRTGCIYIPFDGAYPEKRLEYMLEDSEAVAILTTRGFWESKRLGFPEERVIFLDELQEAAEEAPDCGSLGEDSPAMLLYTSGTTGKPKGVLHTHRMLLHIVDCIKAHDDAALNADTRSGVMSSFPFVATQMFLLGPILNGGTVCIAPEAARKDMDFLYRFLKESRVTHVFIPSGLAAIMAEDYDLSGMFVFAAGEKLRNFRAFSPDNILINMYGSTETSAIITKKIRGDEERILVGKPYHNTITQILDDDLKPVAPGEAGELLVSNDYMSTGYYKLPELSAGKWVELDGARWFRTGDRAAYSADGDIDILGRTDNMIKLRGYRIETGEVEAQIANAVTRLNRTDVGQIVVVVKTIAGVDHLSCYYEAKKDLDKKAATAEISDYLAEYMVPDVWVRMDALPRNLNGKVMRNELPQPKRERRTIGVLDSEVVVRVLMTAADILDTDYFIGPDDRFTDLGGTSLNAMEYSAALREQGIKIGGAQILQHNTFRRIAEAAQVAYEQLWPQDEYEAVKKSFASRGEHIEKVLPISTRQDEMLFEQIIFPDSAHFRNVVLLQMDSIVSREHLREALDVIAAENEELRSAVVFHDVTVIQQVITDRKIPLEMVGEHELDGDVLDELTDRLMYAPLDLQYNSMMQAVCLHARSMSFLYIMTHYIAVGQDQLKAYMARLMSVLEQYYPADTSISGWREMLETSIGAEDDSAPKAVDRIKAVEIKKDAPPDVCVYSENSGPKVVFVHTGNTGSSAYYRLADRIGDDVSFSVIEPYNLYHPDDARYGIKNIAKNYVRILKEHQPEGPYILGGWCYGGVVAHEMACQLEAAGEEVKRLFMLDSHALGNAKLREMSKGMLSQINAEYFETSPLFAELRENGMLDAMISNAVHVSEDLMAHNPSFFHGDVTYFKPDQIPAAATGDDLKYWSGMMKFEAGNYENYCDKAKLRIIHTPHEHDLMMDDPSLEIIVPEFYKGIFGSEHIPGFGTDKE